MPKSSLKTDDKKPRHLHKFCGYVSQFYFKEHTAKHIRQIGILKRGFAPGKSRILRKENAVENKIRWQLRRSSRLVILIASVILAMILIWLVITGSSMASAQIAIEGVSSKFPQISSSSTINLEFHYAGDDPEGAVTAANQFASLLSQETGLDIHATIGFCEHFIVDNLGAGQVDLAPLSSVAYVLGHEKFGIEAELVNGAFDSYAYRGQINIPTSRGYTDIWDMQGKQFTSTSPESLTGFMLPYLLISETTGMTPTNFFGEIDFVGSHAQVIKDVYTGTTDCGSTYEDARASVAGDYPDVFDVVSVLTYTEYMPQNPWAFRQGLDEDQVLTLANGIITVTGTTEGEDALEKIFGFDLTGITTTQDDNYDIVRDLIKVFGLHLAPCNPIYLPVVTR